MVKDNLVLYSWNEVVFPLLGPSQVLWRSTALSNKDTHAAGVSEGHENFPCDLLKIHNDVAEARSPEKIAPSTTHLLLNCY